MRFPARSLTLWPVVLWLAQALCPLAAVAQADSLLSPSLLPEGGHKRSSALLSELGPAQDFLPLQEAYQLEVTVQANGLHLDWQIAEGYYLYGEQFRFGLRDGDHVLPLEIQASRGVVAYDDYFAKEVETHRLGASQRLLLQQVPASGQALLEARFQGCADAGLCYPPETWRYAIDFRTQTATFLGDGSTAGAEAASLAPPDAAPTETSFALMFAFALLGGLILNLMPCVFPVLTLKLMGFARSNSSDNYRDSHVREHSWCYTLGVLCTFLLIAGLLMALRQGGAAIGWGFQLQSPVFIALLALLFLLLALSMSGFITLGTRWMGVGDQLTAGNHYHNSFFTGVLAVIVASPCSVPFMGVALGYALTQPLTASLVIFAGLGLGLASPFLVFAYVPWLIKHLPRPGPWMETLKHWLALPLYLSTLWLLWVLWHQLVAAPTAPDANQHWEKYSAVALEEYRARREPVFVELTADWCITCLVNEKVALTRPAVLGALKENTIHYLRGDWTNRDPEITALLKQHQRAGVPLYLYYDRDGKLSVLPQLLTEQMVLDVLKGSLKGSEPF